MKPRLAPRHIIPTVCYAILLFGFAFVSFLAITTNFTSDGALDNTGMMGLLVVSFAIAVKLVLILIGVGGAVMLLFPLVFSALNIAKRGRKLAIACLVFDILLTQCFFICFCIALSSANGGTIPLILACSLALSVLSLAMNILNIQKNRSVDISEQAA